MYFFFSGHGSPDTAAGKPFLVPYDGDARYLEKTSVSLALVLSTISQTKAKDALVIVDTCFSGSGGRSVLPPGARPLMRIKEEKPAAKIAVFSASAASEISGPSSDKSMGAFSKYVVDGLGQGKADLDGDGQVTLKELEGWVSPRVAREARGDNREQHPSLAMGDDLGDANTFVVAWGVGAKK